MPKPRPTHPAFPTSASTVTPNGVFFHPDPGMTIREHFASLALQGLLAHAHGWTDASSPAALAVLMADALIAELAKEPAK